MFLIPAPKFAPRQKQQSLVFPTAESLVFLCVSISQSGLTEDQADSTLLVVTGAAVKCSVIGVD